MGYDNKVKGDHTGKGYKDPSEPEKRIWSGLKSQ